MLASFLAYLTYIYTAMVKKLFLVLLITPLLSVAQQTISGTFTPAENYKWGILYQVTPTGTLYTADTQIDEKGQFTMPLDSTVTPGVYRFVYGVPPEANNFEFIYNAQEDINLSYSEETGLTFNTSDENKRWVSYTKIMDALQHEVNQIYTSENPIEAKLDSLFKQQESVYHIYKGSSKGKMVSSFINAYQPYIPVTQIDAAAYIKAKSQHFLEVVNFNNPVLQKSGFLLEQSLQFLKDSPFPMEKNIDGLAKNLAQSKPEFQKVFMTVLWNRLQEANKTKASNYLATKYLIPLATELGDKPFAKQLQIEVSTSVGAKSPNFSWKDKEEQTQWFHDLETAKKYILVFWSSSCSHCLMELPKLQKKMASFAKDEYQVVAFGLEDDIYSWRNEILRLPEFLHIPGLGKWQNETGNAYNVSKTPTYYVMNSEKVIIAKPNELVDLFEILSE